jgi:DNA-binding transcriptional regulator YdaS (Cro superfamily)
MHPLERWLKAQSKTRAWLAEKAGLSRGYVSDILNGKCDCGGNAAIALQRATRGAVTVQQLITWKRRAGRRADAAIEKPPELVPVAELDKA